MFPSDLLLTWNRLINKLSNKSVHKGEGHKLLVSDRIDCIRSDWAKLVSSYVLAPNLSTKQMTFTRQIAQVGKIRLVATPPDRESQKVTMALRSRRPDKCWGDQTVPAVPNTQAFMANQSFLLCFICCW